MTIILITSAISFVSNRIINIFEKKANDNTNWICLLIWPLRSPLKFLIYIIGAILVVKIFSNHFKINISHELKLTKNLAVIFCLTWFVMRIVKKYEQYLDKKQDKKVIGSINISIIIKALKVIIGIIALLLILQAIGVSITGLVAFGGIGGIALGFAAKDLLANLLGATMIYFDHPFDVGDWVRSPDREIEGIVERVGWSLTHIRTFDKRILYIPNAIFGTLIIENPSRMTSRRINEIIRLRYKDIDKIIAEIKEMIVNHKGINKDQGVMVHLSKFGESAMEFFIDAYTYTKRWDEYSTVKQEILLKVNSIVNKNNAEIAVLHPYYMQI